MPYYRRRYTRRNSYRRRGSRTLSSYNVATRTSARSQARQIYALNRRITRIQRQTRPEIEIFHGTVFTQEVTAAPYTYGTLYTMNPFSSVDDNFARQLDATVYFNANYNSMTATVQPVTFRVVVFQTKVFGQDVEPSMVLQSINNGTGNTAVTVQNAIFGPLADNTSRQVKVLRDRKYVLSYQRPQIMSEIRCRNILNFAKGPTGAGQTKGTVYVAIVGIGSNNYNFRVTGKVAYTDA